MQILIFFALTVLFTGVLIVLAMCGVVAPAWVWQCDGVALVLGGMCSIPDKPGDGGTPG